MKPLIHIPRGVSLQIQVGSDAPLVVSCQSRNGLGCRHCVFNCTPTCDSIACEGKERFDHEDVMFLPEFPDRSRGGDDE